ncbi:MAG: hypothetical protein RMI43_05890 [Candidatus Caldarchaeum sp.]|nr:hypothetical protein [Candidatus Caldarchaeum sp.]MCX8201417.1 hypothetical protein [Candidatus Caldarchaeum sp.]MDW8063682.1 hypothetical protein [Candidatus Caldarchaeum sp.]MDW8435099.1 hypothetical protein [Candidatus Caldarchaeum sp.]
MTLSLKEKIELMRQGIIHRYIVPTLELRGFLVSEWKRPISLEDKILRDDGWKAIYTNFTTWETYSRNAPLHVYFNTFYGDIHEKAYRVCFVEFILNKHNYRLPPAVTGIFTRLNVENGYYWKHKIPINLDVPESAVNDIDSRYDELLLALSRAKVID